MFRRTRCSAATGRSLASPAEADRPGALSYREEEMAGVQPKPDKARGGDGDVAGSDEEASGAVLIGYGTSGHKATSRSRPSKRGHGATRPTPAPTAEAGAPQRRSLPITNNGPRPRPKGGRMPRSIA